MSFIRTKEIPPGSGNHYEYEVESYRDGDSVRQRVIRYIGRAGGKRVSANRSRKTEKVSEAPFSLGILPEVVEQKPEAAKPELVLYRGISDKQKNAPTYLTDDVGYARNFGKNIYTVTLSGNEKIADFTTGAIGNDARLAELGLTETEIVAINKAPNKREAQKQALKSKGFDLLKYYDEGENGKVSTTYNLLYPDKYTMNPIASPKPEAPKPDVLPVMIEQKPEAKPVSLPVSSGAEVPDKKASVSKVKAGQSQYKTGLPATLTGYHGTDQQFETFSTDKLGSTTKAKSAKEAVFFSTDSRVASIYAENAGYLRGSPEIDALYKEIRNQESALRMGDHEASKKLAELYNQKRSLESPLLTDSPGANVRKSVIHLNNPYVLDIGGISVSKFTNEVGKFSDNIRYAKEQGHDGVIYTNANDSGVDEEGNDIITTHVAIFPEFIQSAMVTQKPRP